MTAPVINREEAADQQPRPWSGPSRRLVGAWPVAVRLARREVRRRPGRTLLVMLLVLVPVAAMTVGSVMIRTDFGRPDRVTSRIIVNLEFELYPLEERSEPLPVALLADVESIVAEAGPGFRTESTASVYSDLESVDGTTVDLRLTEFADWQADELAFDRGRVPTGPDEVVLARSVAEAFGVDVGDRLLLAAPERDWAVVGVARSRSYYGADFAYVGELDRSDVRPGRLVEEVNILVDPGVDNSEIFALGDRLRSAGVPHYYADLGPLDPAPSQERTTLAWGWVAGVVSMLVVGVVIAAAFATSARRQLVTVGQLAANGAPERVVRRSLALQGSWSGLFGAAAGLGLGLLAVFAVWPWFEELVGRELPSRQIVATDLVVIGLTAVGAATIAARLPARTASKVPVLTALAGRRPVGQVLPWVGPTGGIAAAAGLGLLVLVVNDGSAGGNAAMLTAVVGCVLIGVGLVCAAPLLIETVGRLGAQASGATRLAARSLARQRSRSAPIVAAITVVMALTTALLTGLRVSQADDELWTTDTRYVTAQAELREGPDGDLMVPPMPVGFDEQLAATLPDARRIEVRSVLVQLEGDDFLDDVEWKPKVAMVDEETASLVGLDDDGLGVLVEHGIVRITGAGQSSYGAPIRISGIDAVPKVEVGPRVIWADFAATEAWVAERGLEATVADVVFDNGRPPTEEERQAIEVVQDRFGLSATGTAFISVAEAAGIDPDPPAIDDERSQWWIGGTTFVDNTPWRLIQSIALVVALGLVLLVIGIGLGLSAVESRDERNLLFVTGARPATISRVAAIKAGLMTVVAAAVAVPVGYLVVWVIRSLDPQARTGAPVPKLALLVLIIVVPLAVATATWLTTAVLNRFRPVTASSMSDD